MQRFLLRCGVAAAIIYLVTLLIGGLITPGYSHLSQTAGELVAPGARHAALLSVGFLLYSVSVGLFALGLLWRLWEYRQRNLMVGAFLLLLLGASGVAMYFLPLDPAGGPVTLTSQLHLVLAAACSLLALLAPMFTGLGFGGVPGLKVLWLYSIVSSIIIGLTWVMATAGATTGSPYLGAYERISTGTFLLWMVVLGLVLPRRPEPPAPEERPEPPMTDSPEKLGE